MTIKDVAKKAGVGVGTVSRVINGSKSVNDNTKKAVLDAIEELKFTPSSIGKRLRQQKSGVIAVMVPVITNPFFSNFVSYVNEELDKNGYSLLLVISQQRVGKEEEILKRLKQKEVDGAICVTHFKHELEEFEGCHIVSIDRHLGDGIPYVTSDNYDATYQALERLIESGAKKIGYIGTTSMVKTEVWNREKAYIDVMNKYNLPICIKNAEISHGEEDKLVEEFVAEYRDVDAIFASGYIMSLSVYKAYQKENISIPNDLQIVSYDGRFDEFDDYQISCIQQPIKKMAQKTCEIIMDLIEGKDVNQVNILKTEYIEGKTTK